MASLTDYTLDSILENRIAEIEDSKVCVLSLQMGYSSSVDGRSGPERARADNAAKLRRQLDILRAHTAYPVLEAIRAGQQEQHAVREAAAQADRKRERLHDANFYRSYERFGRAAADLRAMGDRLDWPDGHELSRALRGVNGTVWPSLREHDERMVGAA